MAQILFLKSHVKGYVRADGTAVKPHEDKRSRKQVSLGRVVAAAKKAKVSLSYESSKAIDEFQRSNWDTGRLESAFSGSRQDDIVSDIERAFAPVRAALKTEYGDTIKLYRGQGKYSAENLAPDRALFSWTSDKEVARSFGHNQHKQSREISDAEIDQAVEQYERTGFVSAHGYKYKRINDMPEYYDIYRGNELITDGSNLKRELQSRQADRAESNNRAKSRGDVMVANVPIDEIVWMTNDLGSKEFIVRRNPLEPGKAEFAKSQMNHILFFKSQIAGYTRRDGVYVKPHSDKRTKRAVVQDGQLGLFGGDAVPPNPFKGVDPVKATPDLFDHINLENQFKQHGDGFELQHQDGQKWAVLMPDASHDDAYRYQVFGASGLKEHHTFANADAALQAAIAAGFTKPDAGAMERLAPEWAAKFADEDVQAAASTHGDRSVTATDKAAITRARRKAVLDVLGDGWKAQAGVDGARDAYKKVLKTPAGKRMEVIIQPEKTVDGNFYVGSHVVGKGGSSGSAKTIEEAKAMAERFEAAAMATAAPAILPKLNLPMIAHDGDTWHVISTGAKREDGKTMAHLSSATRGRQAKNGVHPIQIQDWIDAPAADSNIDHPAPIPRQSIKHLPDGDRSAWVDLHRQQHELHYHEMGKVGDDMERTRTKMRVAESAMREHEHESKTARQHDLPGSAERADQHDKLASQFEDEFKKHRAKLDLLTAQHESLHDRRESLGKRKDSIFPGSGDLRMNMTSGQRSTLKDEQESSKRYKRDYAEHFKRLRSKPMTKSIIFLRSKK